MESVINLKTRNSLPRGALDKKMTHLRACCRRCGENPPAFSPQSKTLHGTPDLDFHVKHLPTNLPKFIAYLYGADPEVRELFLVVFTTSPELYTVRLLAADLATTLYLRMETSA